MKIAKRENGVVYLRNVSYEDRDIIALLGGKARPDLDYYDTFKDSRSAFRQKVEAFELPSEVEAGITVLVTIERGMLTGVYTEPDKPVSVELLDYDEVYVGKLDDCKDFVDDAERRIKCGELVNRY